MKQLKYFLIVCFLSITLLMSSFADSVTDDMVKNIDQTYATLLSKAPKNTRLRKTQQRYRSKIQVNLIKSIKNSD